MVPEAIEIASGRGGVIPPLQRQASTQVDAAALPENPNPDKPEPETTIGEHF